MNPTSTPAWRLATMEPMATAAAALIPGSTAAVAAVAVAVAAPR